MSDQCSLQYRDHDDDVTVTILVIFSLLIMIIITNVYQHNCDCSHDHHDAYNEWLDGDHIIIVVAIIIIIIIMMQVYIMFLNSNENTGNCSSSVMAGSVLPSEQCFPFQPWLHTQVPLLQKPCSAQRGSQGTRSQLCPDQPGSHWHRCWPSHFPWAHSTPHSSKAE